MSFLSALPEIISIELLADWCELKEFISLHSAICNSKLDGCFSRIIKDKALVLKHVVVPGQYHNNFYRWVKVNGVKLAKVLIKCEHRSPKHSWTVTSTCRKQLL